MSAAELLARDGERFAGRRVTVWGLGVFGGGVAAARHLARAGAEVLVIDTKPASALADSVAALEGLPGVRLGLGREHTEADLLEADLVVKSPAVPPSSPWLARLEARGVAWTSELTLGLERVGELGLPFAMVTGSKGKSTTASLAGAMVAGAAEARGARVAVAGNNERPLLDALFPPEGGSPPEVLVLEVSSFMGHALAAARAAGASLPPPAAVAFSSLSPEHVNWHGTVEAYYEAKLALLELRPRAVVLPAGESELARLVPPRLGLGVERVAAGPAERGDGPAVTLEGAWVIERRPGAAPLPLFERERLRLLGPHNLQNALTAAGVARALAAPPRVIGAGAAAFEPLEHRLQTVARSPAGVRFVDDSTATTPEAAIAALAAVGAPVVLLAGGSDKGADYAELGRAAAAAHTVVCLGDVGGRIADATRAAVAAGLGGADVVRVTGGFDQAFAEAVRRCPPGGTVLLSPAAASYDMFTNFKARGARFRALARAACGEPES